jgi:hypothetical protein
LDYSRTPPRPTPGQPLLIIEGKQRSRSTIGRSNLQCSTAALRTLCVGSTLKAERASRFEVTGIFLARVVSVLKLVLDDQVIATGR